MAGLGHCEPSLQRTWRDLPGLNPPDTVHCPLVVGADAALLYVTPVVSLEGREQREAGQLTGVPSPALKPHLQIIVAPFPKRASRWLKTKS